MMDAEQLQAAYDKGRVAVSTTPLGLIEAERRRHIAGLAEIARQQAEHDARVVEEANGATYESQRESFAAAIRAPFSGGS